MSECQVILTTHSPSLAQELPIESLRFINRDSNGHPIIACGYDILSDITEALGIFPNTNQTVKVILCVEGPTDVIALQSFSRCLREQHEDIVDLATDQRVLLIPLGGSILKYWVERQYLSRLGCPEIHIYDNDVKTYQKNVDEINARTDGSWAVLTRKREIENYLHKEAIYSGLGIEVNPDTDNLPKLVSETYYEANKDKLDARWKDNTTKNQLSKVFSNRMNYSLLMERDPDGEIKGWFDRLKDML